MASAKNGDVSRALVCLYPQALGNHKMLRQGSDEVRFLLSKDPSGYKKKMDWLGRWRTEHTVNVVWVDVGTTE